MIGFIFQKACGTIQRDFIYYLFYFMIDSNLQTCKPAYYTVHFSGNFYHLNQDLVMPNTQWSEIGPGPKNMQISKCPFCPRILSEPLAAKPEIL